VGTEVLVAEPVGVALEGEDFGVVDEPVDHRHRGHLVAEGLAPGAERLVRRDDHRGALVAGTDQAEQTAESQEIAMPLVSRFGGHADA
jgi:hypothetical protein